MSAVIRDSDIDANGVFKYILIKISGKEGANEFSKEIVRGYGDCAYHCK